MRKLKQHAMHAVVAGRTLAGGIGRKGPAHGVENAELIQLNPTEAFSILWVKLPVLCAIFLASPWLLFQIWGFIAPGLYKNERRWAGPFIVGSALRLFQTRAATPLIAQQMMLPSGTYALYFMARADKGPTANLRWELRCLGTGASFPHDLQVPGNSRWLSITLKFDVPDRHCRDQRLALERMGSTIPQAIWLDRISVLGH